jgi:DNA-binding MarR family transcriptional regulator
MRYPPIDGLRPGELAVQLGLSKQATNDIVRELERTGYVRLERDPSDGRARIVRYTERGWRFYEVGAQLSQDVGRRWAQQIGDDQYACFEAALRLIVKQRA